MAAIRTEAQLPQALSMSSKYNHQHKGVNCNLVLLCCMVATTPQSMMNAKLSLHGHSGAKLHAVLPDSKNIEAGISKRSKVLSLRCKKVCHKWK